ncbi:MAG: DM13 domain-containing protein [Pseudomonadota bacterium]|nr:DM13 domain-containing protein [Pseudomonadota bacterium]
MKHLSIGLLVGAILGSIAGFGAGIFYFPFLFPPPPVNEVVSDKTDREQVATGTFIHADPSDPVHYGSGAVTVYGDLLHLGADFEVGPGPKYHVYLAPDAEVTPDTRVEETMFVDLGRLKAFSGSQNYPVPGGVDLRDFKSVVIWCEQFNVLISPAMLEFSKGPV